jgi:hypothetical protein
MSIIITAMCLLPKSQLHLSHEVCSRALFSKFSGA